MKLENISSISKKQKRYFELAREAATFSDYERVHIGCVSPVNSKMVLVGWNQRKTHPSQAYYNSHRKIPIQNHFVHAEINLILQTMKMPQHLRPTEIYVYRETKDGNLANSKPCSGCMASLITNGFKKIWYTHENGISCLYL